MPKEETKLVSVRLPLEDYERLAKLANLMGESVSRIIRMSIHCGLIIGEAVERKGTQDGEGQQQ